MDKAEKVYRDRELLYKAIKAIRKELLDGYEELTQDEQRIFNMGELFQRVVEVLVQVEPLYWEEETGGGKDDETRD